METSAPTPDFLSDPAATLSVPTYQVHTTISSCQKPPLSTDFLLGRRVERSHHVEMFGSASQMTSVCLCCRRHASLPVEVVESPVRLESAGRRRDTPCRKWKSASFGYSKTCQTVQHRTLTQNPSIRSHPIP